jgi:hypothetical protein
MAESEEKAASQANPDMDVCVVKIVKNTKPRSQTECFCLKTNVGSSEVHSHTHSKMIILLLSSRASVMAARAPASHFTPARLSVAAKNGKGND